MNEITRSFIRELFEEIDSAKPRLDYNVIERMKKKSRTSSPSPTPYKTNMTRDQLKYCGAIMRNLKKHRDAGPFLHPVDYVKLNVPDYPKIIKHPMDLSTVDRKLNSGEYDTVEDFIADIRLVFNNCFKFNGPEAMISMLCQNVESAFEKSLRQMPPSKGTTNTPRSITPLHEDEPEKIKKKKTPIASPVHTDQPIKVRRISEDGRPKREIHPPPSKDYPETMTKRRNPRKNDIQMRYCLQTLKELKKNKYRDINYPFLVPVDVVALNIPDYVDIVKHPMDLATIERKLNEGDYEEPEEFEDDIRLMFNNCYLYNPPSLPVHKMGRDLEKVFDEKWAQRPVVTEEDPLVDQDAQADEDEEEEEIEDDQDDKIAELERRIASISQQIASIKQKKKKPERVVRRPAPKPMKEKKVVKEKRKRGPNKNPQKRKMAKLVSEEFPEFTFDQKKDLSECINNLTGDRLNTVVSIIQSSMPNLDGQGQEEIILDIDSLDRRTLHRLHEFVKGESLAKKSSPIKRERSHYSQQNNNHNESSTESESDSSSGSDSDDSGSSTD
ncbi:Bromodomain-containing protein [Pilobolus umbonatus]|nr:Bromodomain-containing protein [Pilobolus umbonatus]